MYHFRPVGWKTGNSTQTSDARERGSALLEVALTLPIILTIMMGIMTGGTVLGLKISVNDAAREAARVGATKPISNNMAMYLSTTADVAVSAASGDLDVGVEGREVCVAFVSPGTDPSDRTTKYILDENDVGTMTVGQSCFDDGRPSGERRVQVLTQRTGTFQTGFTTADVTLTARTSVRFERFNG